MKRKHQPPPEPAVVEETILEQAHLLLDPAKTRRLAKCTVCGAESAPNSNEDLCWVCRRLKVSAWRESDQQMPAQE